jgi:FtsZ-interacting cell division protein ZipA
MGVAVITIVVLSIAIAAVILAALKKEKEFKLDISLLESEVDTKDKLVKDKNEALVSLRHTLKVRVATIARLKKECEKCKTKSVVKTKKPLKPNEKK